MMKTFKNFINEETMPFAQTEKGVMDVRNPEVRDSINTLLDSATAMGFITPYTALEKVSKVLANFHILLPKYTFASGNDGMTIFEINQFGPKIGMNDSGEVVTKESSPYYIYFEYATNESGMFEVFASVVDEEELSDIIEDYESEMEDDEEEDEAEELDEASIPMMAQNKALFKSGKTGFRGTIGSQDPQLSPEKRERAIQQATSKPVAVAQAPEAPKPIKYGSAETNKQPVGTNKPEPKKAPELDVGKLEKNLKGIDQMSQRQGRPAPEKSKANVPLPVKKPEPPTKKILKLKPINQKQIVKKTKTNFGAVSDPKLVGGRAFKKD